MPRLVRVALKTRFQTLYLAIACVLLLALVSLTFGLTPAVAEDGYWKQTQVDTLAFEWDDMHTFSVGDGSATQTIVSSGTGDVFRSTGTWTTPKSTYAAGEIVELTLSLKIDEYVRNAKDDGYIHPGLNSVGDDITARIDAPGMQGGSRTNGAVLLRDASGEYIFGVRGSDGQRVVPSVAATVTGAFPAGYSNGEERAIYVETHSGAARYTYVWTTGGETPTTGATEDSTDTTEVVLYDSRVRFREMKGQVEVCLPIGYTADGPFYEEPRKWVRADRSTRILVGTIIRVPHGASAKLSHPYGWKVALGSETTVTIGRFWSPESMLPETGLAETLKDAIGLDVGWIAAELDAASTMYTDTSVEFRMKRAVVKVKGTRFILEEDGVASTVKVMEGTIDVESIADGTSQSLGAGEMLAATSAGLGGKTGFDVDAETAAREALAGQEKSDGLPGWVIAVIVVAAAVVVAAAILAVTLVRYKKARRVSTQPSYGQPPYGQPPHPQQTSFCRQCGVPLRTGTPFCERCGAPQGG